MPFTSFSVEVVSFDMDGPLTDSTAAGQNVLGIVVQDIAQDATFAVDSTYGKLAIDSLARSQSDIKAHEMDAKVQTFEESIFYYADNSHAHGPGSRKNFHATQYPQLWCCDA